VGETAAFDELYGQFQSRVFGLCLQLIRDRHQAQEVTQEVFLQIWRLATFP
jgi:RNA polymerase sigma-70 factor (ECF subfamily)